MLVPNPHASTRLGSVYLELVTGDGAVVVGVDEPQRAPHHRPGLVLDPFGGFQKLPEENTTVSTYGDIDVNHNLSLPDPYREAGIEELAEFRLGQEAVVVDIEHIEELDVQILHKISQSNDSER